MKLKFTRKTWYFFLLAAAAVSMLGGFAVLGGMDFSGLEMIVFCLTGIAVLFLAAQKGTPAREKRNYTGVFVVLMLSKLGASGWAGDICSALVWPALLATEYERGRPILVPLRREDVQRNAPVAEVHDDGLLGNVRAPHDVGLLVGRRAPRDHVHRSGRRRPRVRTSIDARIEHVLALITRHRLQHKLEPARLDDLLHAVLKYLKLGSGVLPLLGFHD